MKAVTVRNLPPAVARAIRDKARRERTSLNRTVISLLEEATGHASAKRGRPVLHEDLEHLAGSWTKEEADDFDAYLKESRFSARPSSAHDRR
jgi:hypothetical protein